LSRLKPGSLRGLPPQVWALGFVSLLTDAASDMVYPLLPQLLMTLGGGAAALGVMEGVAEVLSSFVKIWAGRQSDVRGRRGPFVVFGYGLAALARPCMAIVTAPWQVVVARTFDRLGKGVRSAPRDAILTVLTPPERRGVAFGLHRAMDNMGAVVGGITALVLLSVVHLELRTIFAIALIPGVISTVVAVRAVAGEPKYPKEKPKNETSSAGPLPKKVRALLATIAIFALGASADSFLMKLLLDHGLAIGWIPLAWITLQLGKSLLNVPGGALADRLGPRRVVIASWLVYALSYAAFAAAPSWRVVWLLFPLYALHYGLGEGAEKSLMARVCPADRRGTAFGWQNAVHGLALLPANVIFGFLYAKHRTWAFGLSGGLALMATLALVLLVAESDADDRTLVT